MCSHFFDWHLVGTLLKKVALWKWMTLLDTLPIKYIRIFISRWYPSRCSVITYNTYIYHSYYANTDQTTLPMIYYHFLILRYCFCTSNEISNNSFCDPTSITTYLYIDHITTKKRSIPRDYDNDWHIAVIKTPTHIDSQINLCIVIHIIIFSSSKSGHNLKFSSIVTCFYSFIIGIQLLSQKEHHGKTCSTKEASESHQKLFQGYAQGQNSGGKHCWLLSD